MVTPKRQRSFLCRFLSAGILLSAAFFIGSAFIVTDYTERFIPRGLVDAMWNSRSKMCETQCRSQRSEPLPKGIVSNASDLEMRPLWGGLNKKKSKSAINLLAIAVGIKQKESVNKIVNKFLSSNFVVILFHYDGSVDDWRDLEWSDSAIHVSAINQTKWWFAKRFLHPDIVSEYAYIFLWYEDLGVENFHVGRYLTIIKEGLDISQPALDSHISEMHHHITARDCRKKLHRRVYRLIGGRRCGKNSTEPPCTGWVEMMAPVFSRASWRCAWHMIQNDLVHAWGLDFQLGYCVQGDRTKNIGIVDSEYLVHYGLPTLGGLATNKTGSLSNQSDGRDRVRKRSYIELEIFKNRWKKAVKEDNCWIDPYQKQPQQNNR